MQTLVSRSSCIPHHPDAHDLIPDKLSSGIVRTYESKEHVFCEGDPATHVYQIEAGHVCVYKTMPDGRRQVMEFGYPGDIIGLGSMGEHAVNAQATAKTRVRCIPLGALHELARQDFQLSLKLYEAVSRELIAARELVFTVSQRSAAERVAALLVALARRNALRGENPNEIVLPMTRTDIADYLGLTIETVSRTFTKFRAQGLIDLEQSILVTICDLEALADLAEGKQADKA